MAEAKARVFISYARSDGEVFATELRRRLEAEGLTLWQDRAQMEGGVGWWKQITDALEAVEFMVLVATPNAMESDVVAKEWRYARQQGVCVYPVQVPWMPVDFAALPRWMRDSHFYNLDKEWERFVNGLKNPCHQVRVPFFGVPDLPTHFVKRPAEFGALMTHLLDEDRKNPVAITTALKGAGGFGKTTLAAALCHHEDVQTAFDDGVLWVTLGEQPDLVEALTKLYTALVGTAPGFVDVEDGASQLAEKLADLDCLLVIDDVWNPAHLRPFLRGGEQCARLVTTRRLDVAVEAGATTTDVDEMQTGEAAQMLMAGINPHPADEQPFRLLSARLGEWPLLLEIANGMLRKRLARGGSVDDALKWVNQALEHRGVSVIMRDEPEQRKRSAAGTIDASLNLLEDGERRRYIELAIFPDDVDVPLAALDDLWNLGNFETEDFATHLHDLALLKLNVQRGSIRLHDVVHEYLGTQVSDAAALHTRLVVKWGLAAGVVGAHGSALVPGNPLSLPHEYAWRYCAYHLMAAGQGERLPKLLLDFAWMQAKLDAADANALIGDYDFLPGHDDLRLVQSAVRMSAHVLGDKTQLAGQLAGRLLSYRDERSDLQPLLNATQNYHAAPALIPYTPCLSQAGGPLVRTLTGHTDSIYAVAVSGDGRWALSGSDDRTMKIWDVTNGTEVRTLAGHKGSIYAVALSSDGRWALSGSGDRTVKVWDVMNGTEVRTLAGHMGWVRSVAMSSDGRWALSGSDDRTVKVWDLMNGTEVRTLAGHKHVVTAVAVSGDGRWGLSGSGDQTVKVWDVMNGTEVRTLTAHTDWVSVVALSSDGRWGLSGSGDQTVKVWDVMNGTEVRTLTAHTDWVSAVAMSSDGRWALSGSDDRTVKVWDVMNGTEVRTLTAHTDWVSAVAMSSDGRWALSGSDDRTVKVWDLLNGQELRALVGHMSWISAVAVSSDGRCGLSGSYDRTVKVWDVMNGREVRTLSGHTDWVSAVAVSSNGWWAVSGSDDRTVKVWDVMNGREVRTLSGRIGKIYAVALSGDGRWALSGSEYGLVNVWDVMNGTEVWRLSGHTGKIYAVALSGDGRWALSGSDDRTVKVWDVLKGQELRAFVGHTGIVRGVAMSDDGRWALSGSDDGVVKIWDVTSATCMATFNCEFEIKTVSLSGNGRLAIAADKMGRVMFLRVVGV